MVKIKGTADRSCVLVHVDRHKAWSPCPLPNEPEQLRGPRARIQARTGLSDYTASEVWNER